MWSVKDGNFTVWIVEVDRPARVTCTRGSDAITIILQEKPVVHSESNPENRSLRKNALEIVKRRRDELHHKWNELNKAR